MVFQRIGSVGHLQDVTLIGIDYLGAVVVDDPGYILSVGHMDVAVNQISRVIFVQQIRQRLETPVGRIFCVTQTGGGRMGHHNIHTPVPPELEPELADPAAHLCFGILVGAGPVLPAAAQTQNPDAVVDQAVLAKIPTANGIIMGTTMRTAIAGIKESSGSNVPAYPDFQFGGNPEYLGRSRLDVNPTVEAASSKDRAIVADWSAFRWGYAKDIAFEVIEYGNPDGGTYDLKQSNQVLLRAEAFIGWGFLDPSKFGRVVAP